MKPAAPPSNPSETPILPAEPVSALVVALAVEEAWCDPTNGEFIFDAVAVSVGSDPDVDALRFSLAVVLAVVVPVASDAVDPVDAVVSVTVGAAADSVLMPDDEAVAVPVPVTSEVADAAVAADSVISVIDAAVSVADAEAELLMLAASVCVLSSVFSFGVSEPPDSGNRLV